MPEITKAVHVPTPKSAMQPNNLASRSAPKGGSKRTISRRGKIHSETKLREKTV